MQRKRQEHEASLLLKSTECSGNHVQSLWLQLLGEAGRLAMERTLGRAAERTCVLSPRAPCTVLPGPDFVLGTPAWVTVIGQRTVMTVEAEVQEGLQEG